MVKAKAEKVEANKLIVPAYLLTNCCPLEYKEFVFSKALETSSSVLIALFLT